MTLNEAKWLTLVLGGVRAGKSSYAQGLAALGGRVLFLATAEAGDEEMTARIEAHREDRPAGWDTLEEPVDLVGALEPLLHRYDTVMLDCLTLWVSNLLLKGPDIEATRKDILPEAERLLGLIQNSDTSWIVVSNEVGLGVMPPTELGRIYADELGRINQLVAAEADAVYFMAAGLPLRMKPEESEGGAAVS